jgi:hypothetical protein
LRDDRHELPTPVCVISANPLADITLLPVFAPVDPGYESDPQMIAMGRPGPIAAERG